MVKQVKSNALRFAALIRVSTEQQTGNAHVSLSVQRQQIEQAVARMGGTIFGWYGGAEHAVPGYERRELDRLLADAAKRRFDCFICSDPDRWSRDNVKSKAGLDVFVENRIRFFVQDTEQDLRDPNVKMFLGISAVIGEYFAANQKKKSINARILLAEQGRPGNACLPHGRTWDKDRQEWGIDPKEQARVQTIADRYLAGQSLQKLAAEYLMNYSNLYMILVEGAGDIWKQTFYPHKVSDTDKGPPTVVPTKVPRLLSAETMQAIKARMKANKTYAHGHLKNKYLLSRMVFCADCGGSLSGYMTWKGHRYYRHLQTTQGTKCQRAGRLVRADELEEVVLIHLFNLFGNPVAVQRAIEAVGGDVEKVQEYRAKLERISADLKKIDQGRQRILDLIVKDAIAQGQAEGKLTDLKQRESGLLEEQSRLTDFLSSRPSPEQIKAAAKQAVESIGRGKPFTKMSYDDKRALVEAVFSGKTPDGRRMGVIIRWSENGKDWTFDIIGHVAEWRDYHRLSEKQRGMMREILDAGGPVSDRGRKELMKTKTNFVHSLCGG